MGRRTRLADPAFLKNHYDLLSIPTKEYADLIRPNISDVRTLVLDSFRSFLRPSQDRTHIPSYYNPMYDVMEDHGTTHTSVVDSEGMAVRTIKLRCNLPLTVML